MRKILPFFLIVCLLLCACSSEEAPATTEATTAPTVISTSPVEDPTTPETTFQAPMIALSIPTVTEESLSDNNTLIFSYTTQNFSLILPDAEIAEAITVDYMNRVDFSNSAAKGIYEAATTAFPQSQDWTPYFYNELYSPQRLDQVVLSLYGAESMFDGSPRSTSVSVALNYDLLTGTALEEITQVLAEDYSAEKLCQLIVAQLQDLARSDVLFADYEYIISDMFTTNYPVTNWYFNNRGLCFFFTPYEIAPYSAGTITVEIPYSELNGMIKDQYFPQEQAALYGKATVETYSQDTAFTQMCEIVLNPGSTQYAIRTDGVLFHVRLILNSESENGQDITVLSAATLCKDDGIILQCDQDTLSRLTLSYEAGGEAITEKVADLMK